MDIFYFWLDQIVRRNSMIGYGIKNIIIKYALHHLCAIILSSGTDNYYGLIDVGAVILATVWQLT